ncbi:hypothetical protein H1R20_g13851, partial [Candolleomyces eurysporus]
MSEATETRGDNTAGGSERNTPISPPAATPVGGSGTRSSNRTGLREKMGKKWDEGVGNARRFFGPKEEGAGTSQEAASGDGGTGGAAIVGVAATGTSAGLDITVPQAGILALGQAAYLVLTAPLTAAGTDEVQGVGTSLASATATTQKTNNPLDQEPALGGSDTLLAPDNNAALALGATQEVAREAIDPSAAAIAVPTPAKSSAYIGEEQQMRREGAGALSPPRAGQAGASAVDSNPSGAPSSKTWTIVTGALKKTLQGAVIDVFEQAKSNKEEMEDLKMRCNLLNESMVNAIKGQDAGLLSDDLRDSIGRLVKGISDTLMDTAVKKSTGITAYILVEDDAEALKKANQQIDRVLQCFWIENLIAGALVLSDVRQTVKDQEGWMAKLCVTVDRHFKNAALDKLKNVPSAAYDSQALTKVDTCFEGTRVKLLAGIGRWMSDTALDGPETGKPIYILDGIAGIGKSTVAKTVAKRAHDINSLGASFFFSRDHAERQHADNFVHTIAHQLACCNLSYGEAIATAIDNHPGSLHKVIPEQFSTLVSEPLCNMLKQRATPLVFVFDALDECVESDASAVLNLVIDSFSKLPNVKVFLTARPELVLRDEYQNTSLASCFHLQNIEALIVDSDINLYFNHWLSSSNIQKTFRGMECASWVPTGEEKGKLVQVAGRLFIFASTAVKAILDRKHLNPKHQLDAILSIRPTNAITSLYMQVLNSAKPLEDYDDWMASFKTAIGALVVLQYPLPIKALANLLVLAPVNDGPNPIYKIHHKSFADFVTNAAQSQECSVKEQDCHLHLAKCCLKTMNQQLQFNICQVSPADQYKELADLPNLNKEKLTQGLKYAICHWATHLDKSTLGSLDEDIKQQLEEFANIHLLHWLEALAYSEELDTAYYSMQTALAVL